MIDYNLISKEIAKVHTSVFSQVDKIKDVALVMKKSINNGGKILWCGNGGSAAEAQHMSAELMVRFLKNREPHASIALTTDTSLITAHANDFSFDSLFERQIKALGKPLDILIAISTSGKSQNIIKAINQAKKQNMLVIGLFGMTETPIWSKCDFIFKIESTVTARIQEGHTIINHLICEEIDSLE